MWPAWNCPAVAVAASSAAAQVRDRRRLPRSLQQHEVVAEENVVGFRANERQLCTTLTRGQPTHSEPTDPCGVPASPEAPNARIDSAAASSSRAVGERSEPGARAGTLAVMEHVCGKEDRVWERRSTSRGGAPVEFLAAPPAGRAASLARHGGCEGDGAPAAHAPLDKGHVLCVEHTQVRHRGVSCRSCRHDGPSTQLPAVLPCPVPDGLALPGLAADHSQPAPCRIWKAR